MPVVSDYTALLSGSTWNGDDVSGRPAFLTFSFETAPASYLTAEFSTSFLGSFQAFTPAEQAIARDALQQWAAASGLVLFEVPAGQGDIRFASYEFDLGPEDTQDSAGFGYYPLVAVSPTGAYASRFGGDIFIDIGWADFEVVSHEIGHALGLKHPFEDDDGLPTLDPAIDNAAHTVMTYTYSSTPVTTLGTLDLDAIRYLYGTQAQDGTQVASWSWNATTYVLTQGGSSASETIMGVGVSDVMSGGGGDDHLVGGAGTDRLDGEVGDDVVDGNYGNDTINGGPGDDILWGDEDNDSVTGGSGNDSVDGGTGFDTLSGGVGDDALYTWSRSVVADGGDGDDALVVLAPVGASFNFNFAELSAGGGSVTNIETIVYYGDVLSDTMVGGALVDVLIG
ncbi:MAG: reprolysin-like metallopeptidase, partial [Phenylobacterium sp.]